MAVSINYIWEELSIPLASFVRKRIPSETDADDLQDLKHFYAVMESKK